MNKGRILQARQQGNLILRFLGDVRLTLCPSLDAFLETVYQGGDLRAVVVDLSEVEGVDSTTLGLLAKMTIRLKRDFKIIASIISVNPDITRLLLSMGFDQIFIICQKPLTTAEQLDEIPMIECAEETVREQIIQAHKILMDLNEKNKAQFQELMAILQQNGTNSG